MGWFDAFFGGGGGDNDDPLRKLDPKLREFLEKESPIKYAAQKQQEPQRRQPRPDVTAAQSGPLPASTIAGQKQHEQHGQPQQQQQQPADQDPETGLPPASLYQDGRYAHLWKTYRPLAEVEAETKSDHEKLMDVLEAYKGRKAQIGRAALENCADEQIDWNNCMKSGSWTSRMTMCSVEVRKFERCYMTQSRMLKALGYLSTYDRPAEVDEDIQLHADRLYHRMLDQEAAVEKAKAECQPIPEFPPLFTKAMAPEQQQHPQQKQSGDAVPATPPIDPETRRLWDEKLEKIPEGDRAAEEEAMKAELRARAEMASKVKGLWQEQAEQRKARQEQGQLTIGDRITNWLSFRG